MGVLEHLGWDIAAMMSKFSRSRAALDWRSIIERMGGRRGDDGSTQHLVRTLAPRALLGIALLLAGGVAGLAAGRSMANRAAHRAGACSALNMAAALGYLDADQQRRLRHALSTALNPDVDLFLAGRAHLQGPCGAEG
jgi:hypothetical protein